MKKLFKGIGIAIGVLATLILVLFIVFACLVHDGSDATPEDIRQNSLTAEEVLNREMVEALTQEENIVLDIDAHKLNEMVYGAVTGIKLEGISLIGAYVEAQGNEYQIDIPAKVYGVSTVLRVRIALTIGKESGIGITLKDVKAGKLDADSFVVRKIILSTGTMNSLSKLLADKGIDATIHEDYSVTMSRNQVLTTLGNLCDVETRGLFQILAKLALSEDFFNISADNGKIHAEILTKDILYNEARDGSLSYPMSFSTSAAKTKEMLPSLLTKQVPVVFAYYTNGYSNLKDEKKEIIDSLGLSKTEKGIKNSKVTLADILSESGKNLKPTDMLVYHGVTVNVTEKQLNSVLSALSFIGAGTAFATKDELAYIAVESLDFGLSQDKIMARLILNLNGKRLVIKAEGDATPVNGLSLVANITSLSLGERALDSSYIPEVLSYLNDQLMDLDWLYTTHEAFVIDLEKTIEDHILLSVFLHEAKGRRIEITPQNMKIILSRD